MRGRPSVEPVTRHERESVAKRRARAGQERFGGLVAHAETAGDFVHRQFLDVFPFEHVAVLAPPDFFRRFPEGRYEIEGRAQGGGTIESIAILSHVLAAPPENILVSGAPAAESCDVEPLPTVAAPVTIDWDPVRQSHPEIGKRGPIKVSRYQFFLEAEGVNLGIDLPPTVTEFEIPMGLTDRDKVFKFEIIVRTTTGNNTAVESCFKVQ
jgi:hypothetical protein